MPKGTRSEAAKSLLDEQQEPDEVDVEDIDVEGADEEMRSKLSE